MKIKKFSVYNDFKTGILYKIFIFFGLILTISYVILKIISLFFSNIEYMNFLYNISITNFPNIVISFSILFISFGLILYFFHRQFIKLAEIAKDIEIEEKKEKKK
jgi:hypothetical protein